jgi:AbrB family looped-hinge helix DNA binding protein
MIRIERYAVTLGERGRLVLPAQLRRRLDLQPGDRLILTVEPEGDLRVVTARTQARRLLSLYRDLAPGRSLAQELIAERREEAQREDAGDVVQAYIANQKGV